MTGAVFRAEIWERVGRTGGRTDRRTDASPCTAVVYFFLKSRKTVTVTTLLLFGCVTLLCGKFLFIKLSEDLYDRHAPVSRSLLIHSHWFSSPIIRPWYYLQRRISLSEISSLAVSETFTQRWRQRVGAGSLHANGSVNGAVVATLVIDYIKKWWLIIA